MQTPEQWSVGSIHTDGSYDVIDSETELRPADVDRVVFPVAHPSSDRVELHPAPLRLVDSRERLGGTEDFYRARVDGSTPVGNYHLEMTFDCIARETSIVLRLTHSENVRLADWTEADLREAVSMKSSIHD
jgi:hypothetical protein